MPLILPLASPVLFDRPNTYTLELRPSRAEAGASSGPHRPRDPRIVMVGSGYRARLDGQPTSIVNLSLSGAQLRGPARVLPDQPAIIKIGWPLGEHLLCTVLARVRWVQFEPAGDESCYRVGMSFETWDVRQLKDILRHSRR
jgi:hypothetical protein